MASKSFKIKIDNKTHAVTVLPDLPWEQVSPILSHLLEGKNFTKCLEELTAQVVSCETFDFKDKKRVGRLPGLVMTEITGHILETFPLEKYLKNLRLGEGGKLDKMIKE